MFSRERCAEQKRLLRNEANVASQRLGIELPDIDPIDEHLPGCRIHHARDQVDESALSAACVTDDRDGGSGRDRRSTLDKAVIAG